MARDKYLNKKLPFNASNGQKRLAVVLDEIFCSNGISMTIVYEQRLSDLADNDIVKYYGAENLLIDFYIKELKIAVEYQGQQHYVGNSFFGDNMERDGRKREFLEAIGVRLVEVPFTMGDSFTKEDISKVIFGENT